VDTFTSEERSRIMARVRSKDTSPELIVRKLAHSLGYRFRLHRADLPGKPDLVFPSRHKVIFVHGCFWHQHSCPRGRRVPASNEAYWRKKLEGNVTRDKVHRRELRKLGWSVLVIWECQLKRRAFHNVVSRLKTFLG